LAALGHAVSAWDRRETAAGDDLDLQELAGGAYDQVWLFAVDVTGALTAGDCAAIQAHLRGGGGAMLTRDHQDLGACLTKLGLVGRSHHFHSVNPETEPERQRRDDPYTAYIDWPNYHSGANGDFQDILPLAPTHPLLRRIDAPEGRIRRLPTHPHEGAVGVPAGAERFGQVIAQGRSKVTDAPFNLVVALEAHEEGGQPCGRVVAEATFHRFCDYNWDIACGAPSFVGEAPGQGYREHPEVLADVHAYVGNIASWLGERA